MLIKDFCEKQKQLDDTICDKLNIGKSELKIKRKLALQVELGELANEVRCFKYWSKKKLSDDAVILEEMADCLHFIFSNMNLEGEWYSNVMNKTLSDVPFDSNFAAEFWNSNEPDKTWISKLFIRAFAAVNNNLYYKCLREIVTICFVLGLSTRELENAYLSKHIKNYKRQEEGY